MGFLKSCCGVFESPLVVFFVYVKESVTPGQPAASVFCTKLVMEVNNYCLLVIFNIHTRISLWCGMTDYTEYIHKVLPLPDMS